jgi:predicted nucleic acid-binding protein
VILADTSVWVDHLRAGDDRLADALDRASVFVHPFVIGELACGRLQYRADVLGLLRRLPVTPVATDHEALAFLEARRLMGRGIGWVDVHLLASTALSGGVRLWTRDRRLAAVAVELGLGVTSS